METALAKEKSASQGRKAPTGLKKYRRSFRKLCSIKSSEDDGALGKTVEYCREINEPKQENAEKSQYKKESDNPEEERQELS